MIITQQEFDETINRPMNVLVWYGPEIKDNMIPLIKQVFPDEWAANLESAYNEVCEWVGMSERLMLVLLFRWEWGWTMSINIRSEYPHYGLPQLSRIGDKLAEMEWQADNVELLVDGEIKRVIVKLVVDE